MATKNDSLIRRVCDYLSRNPEEELCRSDIAIKFNVSPTVVDTELKPAVNAKRLDIGKDEDDRTVWRYGGPKVDVPAPFAQGARDAKAARAAKTRATLAIDLSLIQIEKGVIYQAPPRRVEQWNGLFSRMVDIGDSFAVPLQAKHALSRAAAEYTNTVNKDFRFSIRSISETHCRIWRKPDGTPLRGGSPKAMPEQQAIPLRELASA